MPEDRSYGSVYFPKIPKIPKISNFLKKNKGTTVPQYTEEEVNKQLDTYIKNKLNGQLDDSKGPIKICADITYNKTTGEWETTLTLPDSAPNGLDVPVYLESFQKPKHTGGRKTRTGKRRKRGKSKRRGKRSS